MGETNEGDIKPYVMIAIPTKGEMKTRTVQCLLDAMQYSMTHGLKIRLMFAEGTLVPAVRTKLLKFLLDNREYTHILFIDSDMTFAKDSINRLVNHKKDVVCGIAKTRDCINYNIYKKDYTSDKYLPVKELMGNELFEVDACGTAFMLISRQAVEMIPSFECYGIKSEDIIYCEKLKSLNFKIWADLGLRLGHIIEQEVK